MLLFIYLFFCIIEIVQALFNPNVESMNIVFSVYQIILNVPNREINK